MKLTLVSVVPFGLVRLKVKVVVPPAAIEPPKALVKAGAVKPVTCKVAVALIVLVLVSVLEIAVTAFVQLPTLLLVTCTTIVQLALPARIKPVTVMLLVLTVAVVAATAPGQVLVAEAPATATLI